MSRVRPILFNTDMVRAILDGRKTVTRRVAKKIPVETHRIEVNLRPETFKGIEVKEFECHWGGYQPDTGSFVDGCCIMKPPCQPGDILYIRETWFYEMHLHDKVPGEPDLPSGRYSHRYVYKADFPDYPVGIGAGANGWHPSIHMPKEAARIWLKVTDVRVERLWDIRDLRAEGIHTSESCDECFAVCGGCDPDNSPVGCDNEIEKFSELWDSTIKKADLDRYGWDANPWVWVIEFERCERPEGWPT